jgi:hypothetical protein
MASLAAALRRPPAGGAGYSRGAGAVSAARQGKFTCIASFDGDGCGFEQPLLALHKALDGTVAKNAGFLRPEAFLVVVVLTDEDDCSAGDPRVFDPSREAETTLGPFASFRCTRYGVACGGQLLDHVGSYSDCAPLADSYLTHPDEIVSFLAAIKEPTTTFVALLTGDPAPVSVSSDEFGLKPTRPAGSRTSVPTRGSGWATSPISSPTIPSSPCAARI